MSWQTAYLAVSSLVDVASDEALAALSEVDRAEASALALQLSHESRGSRAGRAKALATELAKVARVLEEAELGVTSPRDPTRA